VKNGQCLTLTASVCNIIDLKLFQIYILGIIDVRTREILCLSVTVYPNRNWIIQQFKNLAIDEKNFPRYLIIDNDAIYGSWIDPIMLDYFNIQILRISSGCPWQNSVMERYWKTLKEELIFRLHLQDESSIRYFCNKYRGYYNEIRPHQGISGKSPIQLKTMESPVTNLQSVKYKKIKHAHGLFTEFKVAA